MKNIGRILCAVTLSAVAASCLMLAGCDGGNENSVNNTQYHEGRVEDDLPDMENVVSEQVADEEAWKAAFNYNECKNVSAYLKREFYEDDKIYDAIYEWIKIDGDESYCYGKFIDDIGDDIEDRKIKVFSGEGYCAGSGEDSRAYVYDGNDEYWHKYPAKYLYYLHHEFFSGMDAPAGVAGFSELEYRDGAYRYTYEVDKDNYVEYVCKIINKKVVYVKSAYKTGPTIFSEYPEERIQERYFYNVGTTKLSLPTKTKEETLISDVKGEEVTSAQWESAVAKSAFDNSAMNVINSRYDSSNELYRRNCEMYKFDLANGICAELEVNSEPPIYNIITDTDHGGKNYGSNDNKNWLERDSDSFDFYSSLIYYNYIKSVEGKFVAFTFNAENGEYVAENVTLNSYYAPEEYEEKTYSKVTVTFKDGKLVKLLLIEKDSDSNAKNETVCYIFDYGTTAITVPSV